MPTVTPHDVAPDVVTDLEERVAELERSQEVALTGVEQQYFTPTGARSAAGLPTYVWRRRGDTWKIVVGQNTTAAAPE